MDTHNEHCPHLPLLKNCRLYYFTLFETDNNDKSCAYCTQDFILLQTSRSLQVLSVFLVNDDNKRNVIMSFKTSEQAQR